MFQVPEIVLYLQPVDLRAAPDALSSILFSEKCVPQEVKVGNGIAIKGKRLRLPCREKGYRRIIRESGIPRWATVGAFDVRNFLVRGLRLFSGVKFLAPHPSLFRPSIYLT